MLKSFDETAHRIQSNLPSTSHSFQVQDLAENSWELPLALPAVKPAARAVAQERELPWYVIWLVWGGLSTMVFRWDGDPNRVMLLAFAGTILGLIGGVMGEVYADKRTGRDLIFFWTIFWAIFWAAVFMLAVAFHSLFGWLHSDKRPIVGQAFLLGLLGSAWIGANGGALGGYFRTRRNQFR
jgi:hypothetical protein